MDMMACLPPNAPNANPPPKNLPTVVRSGSICQRRSARIERARVSERCLLAV